MTLAAYNGHEALTFGDYTDLKTGQALRAEPGRVYDIAPASGRVVPEFPEPWFTRVLRPTSGLWIGVSRELTSEDAPAEGDAVPGSGNEEAGGEPAHDEDPETNTPREF